MNPTLLYQAGALGLETSMIPTDSLPPTKSSLPASAMALIVELGEKDAARVSAPMVPGMAGGVKA